ncbi:vitamin B12-dependent ribonucleotide reductase [candidate division KSB1 bacterium]|nr:vitamin B12-dependent ribonucleotide reductase [candidate division KSB1 bacterium]RQW05211.1 MAG: vitamin B12-dependent ribonucleotide reductase [candidate division KSB1 bacterium]
MAKTSELQFDFDDLKTAPETDLSQKTLNLSDKNPIKLQIPRFFTSPDKHPYDVIEWENRTASITNDKGEILFERHNIDVPKSWSQTAINIVASKYFHTYRDRNEHETSVKQLIDRVAKTLRMWGEKDGYFAGAADADTFEAELTHLLVNQKAAFNSPVWFNMGCEEKPQCSACFINSVEDKMEAILTLAKTEGLLFKWGSGTGTNLSPLRSSQERLSTGGLASGPVSFMRGYDAFAGVIKSGGKTRRAAKMVILNIDHPDIVAFINCKVIEEKKAWALIDAGYDGSFGGDAYTSVFFQNSNNSIRVTDEFMMTVQEDREWCTRAITTGDVVDRFRSRDLMKMICDAAHICGDPGIQFHTTINDWHTCPNSAPINASNPCSEYMFVDDSACNLASLNLMKFIKKDGSFDIEAYRRAIHILIVSQEIIVDNSSYPTEKIARNSHKFRPLGLGYANLGALLMYYGLPYDSPKGRAMAATLTALLTGQSYLSSAILASAVQPFKEFEKNRAPMLRVIKKHQQALRDIESQYVSDDLFSAAQEVWTDAVEFGERYGYRNSQVTVLAPTGTIGFMMDCDTTGIEPDLALVKFKNMVGGGFIKLVNNTISPALQRLGYAEEEREEILEYINQFDTIEGAPHIKEQDLPVFDCAFKPQNGSRFIKHMGHVKMMGAVQPFLSGAISKTVNMPNDVTPDDIADTYMKAWELGLKSIAIYRDGSKRTQPLSTGKANKEEEDLVRLFGENTKPHGSRGIRRRLPDERSAITHKFEIGGHEGYLTVGEYEDHTPGEIFVTMAKEGSVVSGLMDCFATSISIGLQSGVPLETYVRKFTHTRFEPYGYTNNPKIRMAKSIADYIFRWLELRYLGENRSEEDGTKTTEMTNVEKQNIAKQLENPKVARTTFEGHEDAPPCPTCGAIMVRNGACYKCLNCGDTSGCS